MVSEFLPLHFTNFPRIAVFLCCKCPDISTGGHPQCPCQRVFSTHGWVLYNVGHSVMLRDNMLGIQTGWASSSGPVVKVSENYPPHAHASEMGSGERVPLELRQ